MLTSYPHAAASASPRIRRTQWALPVIAVVAALSAGRVQAQRYMIEQMPIPGEPKSTVGLTRDSRGFLWFWGGGSLYRFDGSRFDRFPAPETVFPRDVSTVQAAADGNVWIGAANGLFLFTLGQFQRIRTEPIASATLDRQGRLILMSFEAERRVLIGYPSAGAESGLRFVNLPGGFGGVLTLTTEGQLVFRCGDQVCTIREEDLAAERPVATRLGRLAGEGAKLPIQEVDRVIPLPGGVTWMVTQSEGFVKRGQQVTRFPENCIGHNNAAYAIDDGQGTVWWNGARGMCFSEDGVGFRELLPEHGLPRNEYEVIRSADGSVWFLGSGLWRWRGKDHWEFWTNEDGVTVFYGLIKTRAGQMFASGDKGVFRLSADRRRWEPFGAGAKLDFAPHLAEDPRGGIVVATYNEGLVRLSESGRALWREPKIGNAKRRAVRLLPSPAGTIFVGSTGLREAIPEGEGFRFREVPLPGPDGTGILDMEMDGAGRLWVGYRHGVAHQEGNEWRLWNQSNGMLQNDARTIAAGPDGSLWYGYNAPLGFSRIAPGGSGLQVRHFREADGYGMNTIRFLQFDARGWLWRGALDGLYVSNGTDWSPEDWVRFSKNDGIGAEDMVQNSFYEDADGSVWFSVEDRVFHVKPEDDFFHEAAAPRVSISRVGWDGAKAQPFDWPTRLEAKGNRKLRVEFDAPDVSHRSSLRFRYRLAESDAWIPAASTEVELPVPGRGDYRFEAAVQVGRSKWSTPAVYSFTIARPPITLSPWQVGSGVGMLTAISGWLFYLRRERRERDERDRYFAEKEAFARARQGGAQPPGEPEGVHVLLEAFDRRDELPDLSAWRRQLLGRDAGERVGELVGERYRLEEAIADGTFALVFRATDLQAGVACAVKIVRLEEEERDWILRRFEQEVIALRRLQHPGIVAFRDVGKTAEGLPYLVMDYVDGVTLRQELERGALGIARSARLIAGLGEALQAAHDEGVMHRDLKPENLILAGTGSAERLLLIDFSIAVVKDPQGTLIDQTRAAGSLPYMAPEQLMGVSSPASDLYSLALVAFEMLTGRRASRERRGEAVPDLAFEIAGLLRTLRPEVTEEAARHLSSALVLEPSRRPVPVSEYCRKLAVALTAGDEVSS